MKLTDAPVDGLPPFDTASRAVAVTHGGEVLGALSLHKPPNEPLTSTEDELMRHLASQAGLVLRNAALTAELRATIDELRASRRRLVEAQDAERRKIERNLHDGAQQQLLLLTIHLALLEESAANPAAVRELASAVKQGVRAALDDLRDLARGIYPPLLADQGLVPALQAQALKAPLPVEIDADGIGRYPQDAEAAVYFCTLEALQNVTKYANASHATVGLTCSDGSLEFTVTDDGTGFDTANTRHGTGLHGMADRLAAFGGALHVRSQPGHGTILSGRLPLTASGQALRCLPHRRTLGHGTGGVVMFEVEALLREYDRARAYTDDLWKDLSPDEVTWRPHENFSAIGWHLGHQAHVAHFMIRNLTAAEPSPDPALDSLMDSALPEQFRGALPTVRRLSAFRDTVAERVHARMDDIAAGKVSAPAQLTIVATCLLTALVNHEYQHDQWISEVRAGQLGHALPGDPDSDHIRRIDGYLVLHPYA